MDGEQHDVIAISRYSDSVVDTLAIGIESELIRTEHWGSFFIPIDDAGIYIGVASDTGLWRDEEHAYLTNSLGTLFIDSDEEIDVSTEVFEVPTAHFALLDPEADTDEGGWVAELSPAQLRLSTLNDDGSLAEAWCSVTRNGEQIDEINFSATVLRWNGQRVVTDEHGYLGISESDIEDIDGLPLDGTGAYVGTRLQLIREAGIPNFKAVRVNGTFKWPSNVLSGDQIGVYQFAGYGDDGIVTAAELRVVAAEDFVGATQAGTEFQFYTRPIGGGANAQRMVLGADGIGAYLRGSDGAVTQPFWSWRSDPDSGLYRPGANTQGMVCGGVESLRVDDSAVAGDTRFMIYDVDNATLERVTVGAADSGGLGFKVLRIPN